MKYKTLLALLLATTLSTATNAAMLMKMPRQTLTISFGQKKIQMEAPKGMCFLDATDLKQGNLIADMRLNSWKGRKNVVMAVFSDCREVANLSSSKDTVPLTRVGVVRWLDPDIGKKSPLDLQDYMTIREVSYRRDVSSDLTQFKHVDVEKEVKRLDHAVALGYIGKSEIDSQNFKTVGVDATTLIQSIPIDVSMTETKSALNKEPTDTAPLYKLMNHFVEQQLFLNKNK